MQTPDMQTKPVEHWLELVHEPPEPDTQVPLWQVPLWQLAFSAHPDPAERGLEHTPLEQLLVWQSEFTEQLDPPDRGSTSLLSVADEQPGSARSFLPSPSLSIPSSHCAATQALPDPLTP